jgi:Zn-dependent M28 family amino/carboxypeptidase
VITLALVVPLLLLAWGLGLNMLPGRLIQPSSGAVDNGAACAILLGLAEQLRRSPPQRVRVVLALFDGEEANMQGSRAYVRELRAAQRARMTLVNLELLGQNGEYLLWRQDGNALRRAPTTESVNRLIAAAVQDVTGRMPGERALINSDAAPFLLAGMPAGVLGSADAQHGVDGMHRPSDHPGRVMIERLPESAAILTRIIERFA